MVKHKMDHLVCFVPGMLALGVHTGAVSGAKADKYLEVAAGVTHTCWQMYRSMPTGGWHCLPSSWMMDDNLILFEAASLPVFLLPCTRSQVPHKCAGTDATLPLSSALSPQLVVMCSIAGLSLGTQTCYSPVLHSRAPPRLFHPSLPACPQA